MSWLFRPRGIVIDDYEGHSTHWKAHFFEDGSVAIGGVCKLFTEEVGQRTRKKIEADALLIQDAPKLLAEIKRLREAITDIANNMEAADGYYMSGFIEDLHRSITNGKVIE